MTTHTPLSQDVAFRSIGKHPYPIASPHFASAMTNIKTKPISIIDIRGNGETLDLASSLRQSLKQSPKSFPSHLLWNEQGLKFFEEITYSPQYYLTNTEIRLLEEHSAEIAKAFLPGSVLLELGSGCLRKTRLLLEAIEAQHKIVDYYALDLDKNELERTLRELKPEEFTYVRCHGLLGTYDDGRTWMSGYENKQRARCVLSLGSTIGSMQREEAIDFWRKWTDVLKLGTSESLKHDDFVVFGIDGCKDEAKVRGAYNDTEGRNARFILNVLGSANEQLGYEAFKLDDWEQRGEWDAEGGRHAQYLVPKKDIEVEGVSIKKGEKVFVVHSHKYDEAERKRLWDESGLRQVASYMNEDGSYGLHMVSPQ